MVGEVVGSDRVQVRGDGLHCAGHVRHDLEGRVDLNGQLTTLCATTYGRGGRDQPTAPSICSSISRFSSSAYSIGNSRAIGSTKPRTIIAIASSSPIPRLIR